MPQVIQGLLVIVAYLLGSIPSAVWLGKAFHGVDVRDHGSGNAGATNTFRTLGWKTGVPVLLLDVFKGFGAVQLALFVARLEPGSDPFINYQLLLGIAALVGHIFPLFAQFRGGKGIATLLGFMLGVEPMSSLVCLGIFIVILVATRIVSVSSMSAALAFPFVTVFVFKNDTPALMVFSALIAITVVVTHRANIKRLLKKEESKVSLKRKKEQPQPTGET
jgi:glycerol-3-phosphate acyltransferase PlsY